MAHFVNAQAADTDNPRAGEELPPNTTNAPSDVTKDKYTIPLLFLRESELFGNRKPERTEWLQHAELFKAIGQKINVSHITGLQCVRGLWRIYLDNLEDKVTLMAEGVPLRGKSITLLNTNPDRFDGEQTVRVRVKNIPLSVDDGIIKRTITLKEAEVISMYREKLRIDNKLTNCETGDRILIVKASSLKEPLPISMSFGQFTGRILHPGQQKNTKPVHQSCSKCLQDGHTFGNCTNDWVCTLCKESGHKRADCKSEEKVESDTEISETSDSETSDAESSGEDTEKMKTKNRTSHKGTKDQTTKTKPKQTKRKPKKQLDSKQQNIDKYVTPQKGKQTSVPERSPPTPTEELHDKQAANRNRKQQKY